MKLIINAAQVVTPVTGGHYELRIVENGAIAHEGGRIHFVGSKEEALARYPDSECLDAKGKVILPGFVDPHTHLIFAGDRHQEFLMRLSGATYQEIAAAGGGIQSTVQATRDASFEELLHLATANLKQMVSCGTTTVEIKSGYGLTRENEEKMLQVARELQTRAPVDIVTTFLGAHDFPKEVSREHYVQEILQVMLPRVVEQKLAEFCDVFCDEGYYTPAEARRISMKARELGLKVKLHVDELADVGGAALAAEVGATSADHLIFAHPDGIREMARAGVYAVLLPGTSFSLRMKKHAPGRLMIEEGVRVALATDFNPGTCYCHSMQYILQLSALLYSLKPEEAITASTLHAAGAIGVDDQTGSLETGKQMDCLIFDVPHYGYLFYNLGINRLETVMKRGKISWSKNPNFN